MVQMRLYKPCCHVSLVTSGQVANTPLPNVKAIIMSECENFGKKGKAQQFNYKLGRKKVS